MDDNDQEIKKATLVKLAYERHEKYIAAARTIVHFYRSEDSDNDPSFDNLWHILDLMTHEVNALGQMLEKQVVSLSGEAYGEAI